MTPNLARRPPTLQRRRLCPRLWRPRRCLRRRWCADESQNHPRSITGERPGTKTQLAPPTIQQTSQQQEDLHRLAEVGGKWRNSAASRGF